MEGLSKERPQPNIFNIYIIGSVLGQFAIHIATLIYLSNYVYSIEPYVPVISIYRYNMLTISQAVKRR